MRALPRKRSSLGLQLRWRQSLQAQCAISEPLSNRIRHICWPGSDTVLWDRPNERFLTLCYALCIRRSRWLLQRRSQYRKTASLPSSRILPLRETQKSDSRVRGDRPYLWRGKVRDGFLQLATNGQLGALSAILRILPRHLDDLAHGWLAK